MNNAADELLLKMLIQTVLTCIHTYFQIIVRLVSSKQQLSFFAKHQHVYLRIASKRFLKSKARETMFKYSAPREQEMMFANGTKLGLSQRGGIGTPAAIRLPS
eukprot:3636648-Pleurochrysis_carterae.AAC.1